MALLGDFHETAIDDQAAFCGKTLPAEFLAKAVKQHAFELKIFELFGKEPDRFCIGHGIAKVQSEKDAKGNAVSDLQFSLLVGEVVESFEDEDFEHKDDIEGGSSGIGESFFFTDFVEVVAKEFPVDDGIEFRQEVVDLVDFIELFFEVKEAELSFVFAHGVAKGWERE